MIILNIAKYTRKNVRVEYVYPGSVAQVHSILLNPDTLLFQVPVDPGLTGSGMSLGYRYQSVFQSV